MDDDTNNLSKIDEEKNQERRIVLLKRNWQIHLFVLLLWVASWYLNYREQLRGFLAIELLHLEIKLLQWLFNGVVILLGSMVMCYLLINYSYGIVIIRKNRLWLGILSFFCASWILAGAFSALVFGSTVVDYSISFYTFWTLAFLELFFHIRLRRRKSCSKK